MTGYVGLIHRDGKSDFGVSFPDLPELSIGGSTVHEALVSAQAALQKHITGIGARGGDLPTPTSIATLMDDERLDASVAVLVRVAADLGVQRAA